VYRGWIASTSLPECFAYSGSIFSLLTQSDGLSHPASEEPRSSPSWLSVLQYPFLACMHPVHPPTIRLLGPRKFLVDSQKRHPGSPDSFAISLADLVLPAH
ncbi:hypothetical protein AMECASPLE_034642, partial [Ameca splendens]